MDGRNLFAKRNAEQNRLAKRARISPLTVDRIEKGMPSRIITRRKILLGLGLKLSQRRRVFRTIPPEVLARANRLIK
jgi:transcriptional regulator with XRE-family HTH domain